MGYEIIIYNVHGVIHVPRLNLILFDGNVNYDLKILRTNKRVQLLHIIAGEVGFDIKKEKDQNNDRNSNNKQQSDKNYVKLCNSTKYTTI